MANEDFIGALKQLSKRIESTKDQIQTEEATKMSIIIPLFQILGYDVFNHAEFVPEFTADVGIKKGEKVDYAILIQGIPTILIEAKWCGEKLEKHDSQLFRYFATTKAKFAILTNGIEYRFFTDLDEKNKMDEKPFLEVNMLDLKESHISELRKFNKDKFDVDKIFSSASELKYTNSIKQVIAELFSNPTDIFTKVIISDIYDGLKTQKVVDDFKDVIRKSFSQYVNELINDRLKIAMEAQRAAEEPISSEVAATISEDAKRAIVTTDEELQAYYIVKAILADIVPLDKISYKDTETYFGILYDNHIRKWICRFKFGEKSKNLLLPAPNNKMEFVPLDTLNDIYLHKEEIVESVKKYLPEQ